MSTPKPIKLRAGDAVWAIIYEDQDNTKKLDLASDLTTLQIESYTGGLLSYDTDGKPLKIEQGAYHIYINDRDGNTQLKLNLDDSGEIADVVHPLVKLVINLSGAGSVGNVPIKPANLLFGLRWK
jgi:hypothetical protein